MSRSPYFFLERYNNHEKVKGYELQHPYIWNWSHTKRVPADLFPYNGCHELFSIVENKPNYGLPAMKGIRNGLPDGVCAEIQEAYNELTLIHEVDGKVIKEPPKAHWFTYADMYIYCLENPPAPDNEVNYENEVESSHTNEILRPNPLIILKERVDAFFEVIDDWNWIEQYSQIRIVYWIM